MYKIFVAPVVKTSLTAPAKFFISCRSIKNDRIAILPTRFVQEGFISCNEWAHSNELIREKFKLFIDEEIIDGRRKEAKELQHFSWLTVIKMYAENKAHKAK